jgi:hypothetical protein
MMTAGANMRPGMRAAEASMRTAGPV